MKAIKAFVPPFLENGATQFTTATKLRVDSTWTTVSLKRSRYFSRPAPSQLHGTGTFIIPEDHHKKNTYEGSRWNTGTDTQDSEGNEFADETECSNDALICPDIDKVLENYPLSYTCSNHVVRVQIKTDFSLRSNYALGSDFASAFQKQGILKDITNRGQPNAIANESKYQDASYVLVFINS